MRKLIFAMFLLLFVGCTTLKHEEEFVFGSSMKNSYTMNITKTQLDSICLADTLPMLDRWASVKFTDYETNKVYIKRMCRKNVSNSEYMYILTDYGKKYKITRRITE